MELNNMSTIEPNILRQSLRLSRAILSGEEIFSELKPSINVEQAPEKEIRSLEGIRADMTKAEAILEEEAKNNLSRSVVQGQAEDVKEGDDDDDGTGWETWKGPWVPKPIGIV